MKGECTLSQLPVGAKARVCSIDGCAAARMRLCAMGFTPGAEVRLCGASGDKCRVQLRDCCVVLGRTFASSIRCSALVEHAA